MIRTWTLGILCVLLTVFFVGYTIRVQKEDTLIDAHTHMVNSVHYLNMDIERTLYGLNQSFKGLQNYLSAFTRQRALPKDEDIQPVLDELVQENPFVSSLLILNKDGETAFWSGKDQPPSLRFTDYYSIHKTHELKDLYLGRPVASKTNNSLWTFGISKDLRDAAGKLDAVMVATIDLDYMKRRYQGLQLLPDASMTISSLDDYVYLHLPNHEDFVGRYIPGITLKNDLDNKTLVVRNNSADNRLVQLSASRKIGNYPLVVTLRESEATILSYWEKSARNILILGVIVSLVVLFMTHCISRYQKNQQKIKEELRNQASTDSLTGLANRRFVLEQTSHEIHKAKRSESPLSFIMIDLDHFKEVNDNYGHATGDRVLKDTASILRKLCREADIVSRYGGEEFLLVLHNTQLEGALSDAERIRRALERTSHWCGNRQFVVTASFGVSQWLPNEDNCDAALRRADDALYKAKNKGRNSIMSLPLAKVTQLRKNRQHDRHGV